MVVINSKELYHFGIKGMKWGVRRYVNEDGTLTDAGKKRYRGWSNDAVQYDINRHKKANELTTNELNQLNARYNAMNTRKDNKRSAIEKTTRRAMSQYGNKVLTLAIGIAAAATVKEIMKSSAAKAVGNAGKKIINSVLNRKFSDAQADMRSRAAKFRVTSNLYNKFKNIKRKG